MSIPVAQAASLCFLDHCRLAALAACATQLPTKNLGLKAEVFAIPFFAFKLHDTLPS